MISGAVNVAMHAIVALTVRGETGPDVDVHAVLDTGFSGVLMLPIELVETLRLASDGVREATLADGEIVVLDT